MYIKAAQDQRDLVRAILYTYQGHGRNILRGLPMCLLLFYEMNYQRNCTTVKSFKSAYLKNYFNS